MRKDCCDVVCICFKATVSEMFSNHIFFSDLQLLLMAEIRQKDKMERYEN